MFYVTFDVGFGMNLELTTIVSWYSMGVPLHMPFFLASNPTSKILGDQITFDATN